MKSRRIAVESIAAILTIISEVQFPDSMAAENDLTHFDPVPQWRAKWVESGWWHSFELPDGTLIQGVCDLSDLKNRIEQFPIPEDLRGKRVLDIGAWDGWFSFEMERRGAEVLAIDNWDNPRFHQIHAALNSRVEYRQIDMYELTPERVGRFDIVLFMGVLYHLKHPLLALERVCALTKGLAAVDSFVLREKHRPGENVGQRPVMEFYETNEMGGQTDNWVGPSLNCLQAWCRTAGFARVELRGVLENSACLACYRHWEPPEEDAPEGPELIEVSRNLSGNAESRGEVNFSSSRDETVSAWFRWKGRSLGLDDVQPEVGEYGVRPIHVAPVDENAWQTNFKLPPGLTPGWHEARIRIGQSRPGSPQRIAVDAPLAVSQGTTRPKNQLDPPRGDLSPFRSGGVRDKAGTNGFNVQQVVREIHARMEEEEDVESLPVRESEELTALRDTFGRLYQARNAVGRMPPGPNTIRARIGKYVIRVVQRGLFWYTPQIVRFQNETSNALDCVCNLIAWQLERSAALEKENRNLCAELSKHSVQLSKHSAELSKRTGEPSKPRLQPTIVKTMPAGGGHTRDREPEREHVPPLPDAFQFALQDRFRGPEGETIKKLQPYLSAIETMRESLPRAAWLDIGCGRGEWIEAAANSGHSVVGIDSNPVAVAHCRARGLNAEETDALGYLRAVKSESLAVVTAFHAVERRPMGYFLALMQEAVRVLKPGGLMIVETSNPANLLTGSCHFWTDPAHLRPIPPALMEFVYQYFGLKVVKRMDLNPSPREERLPYDEISMVHRLNESLYGPQDYGLIGRR